MAKIHVLSEHLSNMIAAGEVVERPANIVKECVENSIDAQATSISIEAWEGGIDKLVITDDGLGMAAEDTALAFVRHATSKILDEDDLFNIQTMGFRGEALPSIAAVAHVELKTNNGQEATEVVYDYGEKIKEEATSCPAGTRIEVTGLFYKTPARFKYLRKSNYEFSVIAELVNKLALSYPHIRFSLSHNGRLVFQTSGKGNILEIIYQMYGKEVASAAEAFDSRTLDFHIHGYAIQPKINRATKYFMFISVNHRLVRSLPLQNAIIDAYHEFMPPNRYPIFLIDIEVDPQLVDVNVHPNKWEIRLTKQNDLVELIRQTIAGLFEEKLKTVEVDPKRVVVSRTSQEEPVVEQPTLALDTETPRLEKAKTEPVLDDMPAPSAQSYEYHKKNFMSMVEEDPVPPAAPAQGPLVPAAPESTETVMASIASTKEKHAENHALGHDFFDHLRIIGQLKSSYILCENEEGLVIIDQHAAQERYHYEQLRARFLTPTTKTQTLMLPMQVHVSASVMAHVETINDKIAYFGLRFEPFGQDRLLVREVPVWLKQVDEQAFLDDLIAFFMRDLHVDLAKIQKHMIATMACHSSIRFNRNLSMDEMRQVIADLQKCEQPYHCPHGRPTVITLSDGDLRKEFERG